MKKSILILFIGLFLIQCQNSEKTESKDIELNKNSEISDTVSEVKEDTEDFSTTEIVIDSLNIAKKGAYKIILKRTQGNEGVFAEFDFFKKDKSIWSLIQNFRIEKDGITNFDTEFKDFNNDGYNDLTFKSSVAARGANELRSLFLFDKEKERLIHIKNSNSYPNLKYNAELDCIDAWLIYGGSTTLFLKIESDTLREFAGVSSLDTREVFTINENGERKILSQELIKDSVVYRRYSNYNPLKVNEESE
jgi:hypothetical protein